MKIDTGFDFRDDSFGKDPDQVSPTLRKYHKLLWSKPLPGGRQFELDDTTPGVYLHHTSELGEFFLLQDLVTDDGAVVKYFMPFDDLTTSAVPGSLDEYQAYRRLTLEFVEARNRRIAGMYS